MIPNLIRRILSDLPVLHKHGAIGSRLGKLRARLLGGRLHLVAFGLRLREQESYHALLILDSLLELLDFLGMQIGLLVVGEEGSLAQDEVLFNFLSVLPVSLEVKEGILVFVQRSLNILLILAQARLLIISLRKIKRRLPQEVIIIFID